MLRPNRSGSMFAILITATSMAWGAEVRTPVVRAFPNCDQETIGFLGALSRQETEYVADQATREVVETRYLLRGIELSRAHPKFRAGTPQYDLALQQKREAESQFTTHLAKCDPIMSKYSRGRAATRVVAVAASRLDFDVLNRLIDNEAAIEATPLANGKVDNPNSVWKGALNTALGAELFPGTEQSGTVTQSAREKFVPALLSQVKHVNTKEPKGPFSAENTILHQLATSGSSAADYAIKYLIIQKNADPRIRNKKGKTPLDLYGGGSKEVMALLSGAAPTMKLETDQPPLQSEHRNSESNSSGSNLPKGTFLGFISSSLNNGEKIDGTLRLMDQGAFKYEGNNGVTLEGQFQRTSGSQIIGSGVTHLPKLFGLAIFKYPDGTNSTTLKFDGTVTPSSLSGVFKSPHETGTFAFNLTEPK